MNLKKINLIILSLLLWGTIAGVCLAEPATPIMGGFTNTGKAAGFPVTATGAPVIQFAPAWVNYINGLLALMAVLFLVNIIFAGYLWMTAYGSEEKVTRAKSLMINAVIGLGVIIGARLIVELVLYYLSTAIVTTQ